MLVRWMSPVSALRRRMQRFLLMFVGSLRTAVPTHFAKVLIASRAPRHPSLALISKQKGVFADGKEWVQGAFVLPNEAIPDETKLETFAVPGESASLQSVVSLYLHRKADCCDIRRAGLAVEAVERSAGLSLLPEALKAANVKHLCQVRRQGALESPVNRPGSLSARRSSDRRNLFRTGHQM